MSSWEPGPPGDDSRDGDGELLDGMDHIVALLAEITDADRHRIEPPPSVWNAIADTVSADRDGHPDLSVILNDSGDGSTLTDLTPIEEQATTTIALARARAAGDPGLPTDAGAWRRQWLPVAAAVAVAVVGGLVTWAFSDQITDDGDEASNVDRADEEVVAVVELVNDGLPVPAPRPGEARLLRSGDRYVLDLDVPDLPETEGYYEVWIADPDLNRMFSLGVVVGDGRHDLPGNLDPGDYPVVDVSVEAVDGEPAHSGRSIWRGQLEP